MSSGNERVTLPIKSAEIQATITRADGRVEHIGVVSYWHRNPLRRWAWRLSRLLGRRG